MNSLNPACPNPEKDALISFYHATDGDNWNNNSGWLNTGISICDWYGVTCNDSLHVTALDLSEDNLSGALPVNLSDLRDLQTLDLNDNHITSIDTDVFDGLGDLTELNLADNAISVIPTGTFDGLENLDSLDL